MRPLLGCLSVILFMSSSGLSVANSTKANVSIVNKNLDNTITKNSNENVLEINENIVQKQYIDSEGKFNTVPNIPPTIEKSLDDFYGYKNYNAFNNAETDKLQNYLTNKRIINNSIGRYQYHLEYKGKALVGNEESIKETLKNMLKNEIFFGNNQLDFFEKIIPQNSLEFIKVIEFDSKNTYIFKSEYTNRVRDNGTKYIFSIKPNHPFYGKSRSWIKDILQKEENFGKKIIKERVCTWLQVLCESYEYYWVDSKKSDNLLYKLTMGDKFKIVHNERRENIHDIVKKIDLKNIDVQVAGHAKFEISDKKLGSFNEIMSPISSNIYSGENKLERDNPKFVSDLSQHFHRIFDMWYEALFLKLMDKYKNGKLGTLEYFFEPSVHDLNYIKGLGKVQIKLYRW